MNPTIAYLRKRFSQYYESSVLYAPDRFGRREWGFMFLGEDFMQRHISFRTKSEIQNFLVEKVPAHVYHSAAYYERPDASTMEKKKWLGADLIFDLDADHIKGAKAMSYEDTLALVKSEFIRLIDDFLVGDLGFSEQQLTIVFSGGRGYHIHIRDPMVLSLTSHERREIVDYITGKDIDMEWVFEKKPFQPDKKTHGPFIKVMHKVLMPGENSTGWKKKMREGIMNLANELEGIEKEEALARLSAYKEVGEKISEGIYNDLFSGSLGARGIDRMRNEGNLEVFSDDRYRNAFLKIVKGEKSISLDDETDPLRAGAESLSIKERLGGETDEPVTSDVKRLIRLPSSLHGKTGFVVTPLTRSELDDFDPLSDAIPDIFARRQLKIHVSQPMRIKLRNQTFEFKTGESEVPEYVAIFLLCRKVATICEETPSTAASS